MQNRGVEPYAVPSEVDKTAKILTTKNTVASGNLYHIEENLLGSRFLRETLLGVVVSSANHSGFLVRTS